MNENKKELCRLLGEFVGANIPSSKNKLVELQKALKSISDDEAETEGFALAFFNGFKEGISK